ncbi:MAG: choice-of-anchor Q domain-containing protein, partial [Chloroflexota bacterium]
MSALKSNVSDGGTLNFNCAADTTLSLEETQLVTKDLTLTNTGTGKLTISGNNLHQIFYVSPNIKLSLTNLTLTGGNAEEGGAIYNYGGTVLLSASSLYANTANNYGGAIYNYGTVTDYFGKIISNSSTLELSNSSLYANTAHYGGAIYNKGDVKVTYATFLNNSVADPGNGGTFNNNSGTFTLKNSLVQGDSAICSGNFSPTDGGYNLEVEATGNPTCGFSGTSSTITTAKLGTPGDNGGLTSTIALLPGSPAIDAIPFSACNVPILGGLSPFAPIESTAYTTDQRGITRPQGSGCDIGAFEFVPANPSLPSDLIPQFRISPDRVADTNLENLVFFSFKVKNVGMGSTSNLLVEMPIVQGLEVGYFDASVSSEGVWVTQVTTTTVKLALPPIKQGNEVHGLMVFRPNITATVGAQIETRYKLLYDDEVRGGNFRNSNSQRYVFGLAGSN